METRELRHDRHTATLSTDHTVVLPKYRGNLVGDVAFAVEGIICKTFKDLDLEIIDMVAKRIKGKSSRELRKAFPHIKEWYSKNLWTPSCFRGAVGHGGEVVKRGTQNHEAPNAKPRCTGSILKCSGR